MYSKPKIIVVHPGTQHSRQLVKQLDELGLLYQYWTGIAIAKGGILQLIYKILPFKFKRKISNRVIDSVPSKKIKLIPHLELITVWRHKRTKNKEELYFWRNKKFQELIPVKYLKECDIVIGFDTASWIIIDKCKKINKKFILESSTISSITKENIENNISLKFPNFEFSKNSKSKKMIDIELYELINADKVVVASTFCKNSLIDAAIDNNKIYINPYGVDFLDFNFNSKKIIDVINFVFVGQIVTLKGIWLLLEVWKNNKFCDDPKITLTLIGPISNNIKNFIQKEYPFVCIKGKVPHNELKRCLSSYDVLIFPSYFEGFGLVILEAMAAGLPVITTFSTAGLDVITNNIDGIIFNSGDEESLSKSINYFIDNKEMIPQMGIKAREKSTNFSWDTYGKRWVNILN